MSTTVVQTQTQPYPIGQAHPQHYPIGQHQSAVIQLQTVHTTNTASSAVSNSRNTDYSVKAAVITGILQICCGAVLVVLGIAALTLGSMFRSAWNVWGGICFYIVTGIIGVVSRNQNRCMIISYMVMSIISAICAGGEIIYDSVAASDQSYFCYYYREYYYEYDDWIAPGQCQWARAIVAVHSLSAIVGFAEMIISIVASAYCCCGSCGASMASNSVIHYAQPYPGGNVTIVTPGNYQAGPAIINPSQTYGVGPYPQPYGPPPMAQAFAQSSPTSPQSVPSNDNPRYQPPYSPPAYSFSQPTTSVPVPLDPEPRPDTAFK